MVRNLVVSLLVLAAVDATAHKQWMDDAADAQEDYREAAEAKSGAKAAAAAARIENLMAKTEAYWTGKKAADGVKLARDCRNLAHQTATLAKSNKLDEAGRTFATLNATCNSCHELHLEKR